jgi:ribosomal-protein-alanine N-acetyltransferase
VSGAVRDRDFVIRAMRPVDLRAVLEIESRAYTHPWTEGIFRDCMRWGYSGLVCHSGKEILAYGILSLGAGECHILNLCVRPDRHGQGIGRTLLRRLLSVARLQGADTVFLEVRESNESAIGLYLSEGFCETGRRPSYYPSVTGREDALVFARVL